jgi:hypothetical protein
MDASRVGLAGQEVSSPSSSDPHSIDADFQHLVLYHRKGATGYFRPAAGRRSRIAWCTDGEVNATLGSWPLILSASCATTAGM